MAQGLCGSQASPRGVYCLVRPRATCSPRQTCAVSGHQPASLEAELKQMLLVPPGRVLFWSGAGISIDPPTEGPLGFELTDRALVHGFEGDTALIELRRAYTALSLPRDRPRLESILEAAVAEHGVGALEALLADLRDPPPNANH